MPVTRILHRAGNFRELLPYAEHPGVDALEADIWVRGDRLIAHHDRPLGPLPFLVGAYGHIHRLASRPVRLAELLDAVQDHAAVVLDVRSWFGDPAPQVARALMSLDRHDHISVTCEAWSIADRLRGWLPDLAIGYSVRSERQLRDYIHDRRANRRPRTAVAIRHSLLHSPDEVASLRAISGRVTAWTVDDTDRALALEAWGVDAIVSNRISVLNAI